MAGEDSVGTTGGLAEHRANVRAIRTVTVSVQGPTISRAVQLVTTTVIAAADGDAAPSPSVSRSTPRSSWCASVCVNALANHRKQLAIGTGATVIALSIAGVVVAILSSIA